jgi:hypothetical protein
LADEKGKPVANSFYWRSTDPYLGKKTLTGPATAGFEPLATMKKVSLQTKVSIIKKDSWNSIELDIRNPSKEIAFFTQIQLLDGNDRPIRPSFYSDNFFSLLPGESKHITIETAAENLKQVNQKIVVKGYNVIPEQSIIAKQM